jgi:hypothetical protein
MQHDRINVIARAKELLPLRELIRRVGDWDTLVCANLCPFHNDNSPSFSIFEYDGETLWKCHAGCGEGDQITYLEFKYELSRGDAIRKFLTLAGVRHTGGGGRFWK